MVFHAIDKHQDCIFISLAPWHDSPFLGHLVDITRYWFTLVDPAGDARNCHCMMWLLWHECLTWWFHNQGLYDENRHPSPSWSHQIYHPIHYSYHIKYISLFTIIITSNISAFSRLLSHQIYRPFHDYYHIKYISLFTILISSNISPFSRLLSHQIYHPIHDSYHIKYITRIITRHRIILYIYLRVDKFVNVLASVARFI